MGQQANVNTVSSSANANQYMQLNKEMPKISSHDPRIKSSLFAVGGAAAIGGRPNMAHVGKQQPRSTALKMNDDYYDSAPSDCNHDIDHVESSFRLYGLQPRIAEPPAFTDMKKNEIVDKFRQG